MQDTDILSIIIQAYRDAREYPFPEQIPQVLHRNRSAFLVKQIAALLQPRYSASQPRITVFAHGISSEVFPREEFLFDVHVCEFDFFESPHHKRQVPFIKKSLIQIESEFEEDTFEASVDMSKLVCGNAETKVMILSLSPRSTQVLNSLRKIAENISGRLYVVMLPHPEKWNSENANDWQVHRFDSNWNLIMHSSSGE